jgi:hypothetical protein
MQLYMEMEKLIYSQKLDILNLTVSVVVDHENEVKVSWHITCMSDWQVSIMINIWTKYGEQSLYGIEKFDLITKSWLPAVVVFAGKALRAGPS